VVVAVAVVVVVGVVVVAVVVVIVLVVAVVVVVDVVVVVARVFSCQSPGCEAMALTPQGGCKVAQRRGGKQKE
jgi:hypothetical protein